MNVIYIYIKYKSGPSEDPWGTYRGDFHYQMPWWDLNITVEHMFL